MKNLTMIPRFCSRRAVLTSIRDRAPNLIWWHPCSSTMGVTLITSISSSSTTCFSLLNLTSSSSRSLWISRTLSSLKSLSWKARDRAGRAIRANWSQYLSLKKLEHLKTRVPVEIIGAKISAQWRKCSTIKKLLTRDTCLWSNIKNQKSIQLLGCKPNHAWWLKVVSMAWRSQAHKTSIISLLTVGPTRPSLHRKNKVLLTDTNWLKTWSWVRVMIAATTLCSWNTPKATQVAYQPKNCLDPHAERIRTRSSSTIWLTTRNQSQMHRRC